MRLLGVFKDAEAKEKRGPFLYGRNCQQLEKILEGQRRWSVFLASLGQEIALGKDPLFTVLEGTGTVSGCCEFQVRSRVRGLTYLPLC